MFIIRWVLPEFFNNKFVNVHNLDYDFFLPQLVLCLSKQPSVASSSPVVHLLKPFFFFQVKKNLQPYCSCTVNA